MNQCYCLTMKSKIAEDILNNILLETKIKISTEFAFINLIHELGFREEKYWSDGDVEILNKILELAKKHSENIIEIINGDAN